MKRTPCPLVRPWLRFLISLLALLPACGGSTEDSAQDVEASKAPAAPAADPEEDHAHAEMSLGTVRIGDFEVELAQGHGAVVAGGEAHLVVALPYSDRGATLVRAWIGTQDRTLSHVGKGEYAPSHDDYDVHATAPDPLPADPLWWIEIEQPDGTRLLGSAKPLLE